MRYPLLDRYVEVDTQGSRGMSRRFSKTFIPVVVKKFCNLRVGISPIGCECDAGMHRNSYLLHVCLAFPVL